MQVQAQGRLHYEPHAKHSHVPPTKGWGVLVCDDDWYHHWYHDLCQQVGEGRWVLSGGKTLRQVPNIQIPAWGPHISITRGEKIRRNKALWQEGVALSKTLSAISSTLWKRKGHQEALDNLYAAKRTKVNQRDIDSRLRRIQASGSYLKQLGEKKRGMQEAWSGPQWTLPDSPFSFTIDPDSLRLRGTHIWCAAQCPKVAEFRELFGLNPHPPAPLHLTLGVVGDAVR